MWRAHGRDVFCCYSRSTLPVVRERLGASLDSDSDKDPDRSSHVEERLDPATAPTAPGASDDVLLPVSPAAPPVDPPPARSAEPLRQRAEASAAALTASERRRPVELRDRSSLLPKRTPRKPDHTDCLAAGGTRGAGQRYSLKCVDESATVASSSTSWKRRSAPLWRSAEQLRKRT